MSSVFDPGVFDSALFDASSSGLASSGAHGSKRGRELQAFLDGLAALSAPTPTADVGRDASRRRRRTTIKLPARQFGAIPAEYQAPLLAPFGDGVAKGMVREVERRALARAMLEAIERAKRDADEDDAEAVLFLM